MTTFFIFEAIRKKEHGTMLGVHMNLQPVLISEHSELFELLVVQVKSKGRDIRVMTGYGPQENPNPDQTMPFFSKLEEEIISAKLANKSIIIQMDANSKLGKNIHPLDPKDQSPNGAVLASIVERNDLIVVNTLQDKCKGVITRRRTMEEVVEESVIDFLIISVDIMNDLKELVIDEGKEHALTKITHQKKGVKLVTSDHNVLLSKFRLPVEVSMKKERVEIFNFRNKANQEMFKAATSKTTKLSEVFDTNEDINTQTKKFLKRLDKILHRCFKKVRVGGKKPSEYEKLYGKWVEVRHLEDDQSKEKSKHLETELADKYAENIFEKIQDEISGMCSEEGAINSGKLWKLKKKLHKNYRDPPTAMKDSQGNLITEKAEILVETTKYYSKVLEN